MRAAVMSRVGSPTKRSTFAKSTNLPPSPPRFWSRYVRSGTNPVEAAIRSGTFPLLAPPAILGWDLSGVVEEVVPGVTRFKVGDEVYGMPFFPRAAHTYAEYAAAPSRQLAANRRRWTTSTPPRCRWSDSPLGRVWSTRRRSTPGQRVLIHGAGGGVGHVAVQIAKALGAEVIATASAAKRDFVRALGADQVIDYQESDFTKVARNIDVVLELIGKDYGDRSIEVLRPGGLLVTAVQRRDLGLGPGSRRRAAGLSGSAVEPDHVGLKRWRGWPTTAS